MPGEFAKKKKVWKGHIRKLYGIVSVKWFCRNRRRKKKESKNDNINNIHIHIYIYIHRFFVFS